MTAKKSVDLFIPFPFSMLVEVAAEIPLYVKITFLSGKSASSFTVNNESSVYVWKTWQL